jgi:hypothetical protein
MALDRTKGWDDGLGNQTELVRSPTPNSEEANIYAVQEGLNNEAEAIKALDAARARLMKSLKQHEIMSRARRCLRRAFY